MTQDVKLPNGTYTMRAWVRSTGGQNSAMLYVRGAGADKIINVNRKIDNWEEVTISDIQVTNGTVQIGICSDAKAGNWLLVDDFPWFGIRLNHRLWNRIPSPTGS